jgi:propanol-preferring alcohol dehydrogenase
MTDIPRFPYEILWGERQIRSVANLSRGDGVAFIDIAQKASIRTHVVPFPLASANSALAALRDGALNGAAVLQIA